MDFVCKYWFWCATSLAFCFDISNQNRRNFAITKLRLYKKTGLRNCAYFDLICQNKTPCGSTPNQYLLTKCIDNVFGFLLFLNMFMCVHLSVFPEIFPKSHTQNRNVKKKKNKKKSKKQKTKKKNYLFLNSAAVFSY